MIVCKGNVIYMWAWIQENFLGNYTEQITSDKSNSLDMIRMGKVTNYIIGDTKKNDFNYTEIFFNSRKLFNTKYNQFLLKSNIFKLILTKFLSLSIVIYSIIKSYNFFNKLKHYLVF
jgi:hypothetical protein